MFWKLSRRSGALITSIVFLSLVIAPAALAAGDGEKVGENLGGLLGSWAKSLYMGIAAVVAVMFLLNRRFADLAVFVLAAVVVGGFVMAPAEIAGVVKDIWHTVAD